MKKILKVFLIMLLIPTFVMAKEKDSFFTKVGEQENITTNVNGSSLILGDSLAISNETKGVSLVFGNSISYTGNSEYGAIFGNTIAFAGKINDAAIFGNLIDFDEESNINRDIIIFGNSVNLSGNFKRDVRIYASSINIDNANINGDIYIDGEKLNIDKNSIIEGKLSYNDDIEKNIKSKNIGSTKKYEVEEDKESIGSIILAKISSWISLIVILAVLVFISPKLFDNIVKKKEIGNIFGYGALLFIFLPIVAIILLFTSFAFSLSIISLMLYGILVYLSTIITGYYIGYYVWDKYINRVKTPYLVGILGITILFLLQLIPIVGTIINIVSIIFSFGIIVSLLKRKKAIKK